MDSKDDQKKNQQQSSGPSVGGIMFILLGIVVIALAVFAAYRWYKSRSVAPVNTTAVPGPNAGPMPGSNNRLSSGGAPAAANVGKASAAV